MENNNAKKSKTYKYIAFVHFKDTRAYSFGCDEDIYTVNEKVIVETVRGNELGVIAKASIPYEEYQNKQFELKPVVRKASEKDIQKYFDNAEKAKEALLICQKEIKQLNLDMNLIEAEYTLDSSKLIFTYAAEERVDFRELLKVLATRFHCRIELRQIGPRNKAKMVGGLGQCGRELCCAKFMNDFDMISINMAKNQLLALNIQKLSGQCGKLKCCLKFEDEQYKEMRQGLPKLNSKITYEGKIYRVTSMNVITKEAKIENREDVRFLSFEELWPDIDFTNR
ncbi:MAG: stage 0 sporulation protein [Erysipelotrichia bacterium]|nr:stage 0 sporulation protein [Erysipelotrichia bacterium]NCC54596.1 stage 0 sporulation protein [Erysipelotrichia bacterium]